MKKLISFRVLKKNCVGHREDSCYNIIKGCTAKNCPIWKKLEESNAK